MITVFIKITKINLLVPMNTSTTKINDTVTIEYHMTIPPKPSNINFLRPETSTKTT